ncbi:phosphate acyltransferase PlsX [Polycyclovorans algicola]|uniref:phosphate acyltransferase PlsX n=1 Tax=Polycyclovorans algicola TaxID=616992 RepID=UPI000693FFFF|nr:phosphate acyltransferase PlsX [Polycyclovorans algicola]
MLRIAVDVMGGDVGVSATIPAVALALQADADVHMVLVGNPEVIEPLLVRVPATLRERISLHAASEVVGMDELPSKALRLKKDSSMRVALDLVKSGQAQAMVSAGNTGALMATAKFVLKTLPKIDRPAIVTALPSMRSTGHVHLLDLGANAECTAEQLVQFAVMGAAMVSALEGITQPRVALLNIGSEEIKGNDVIRAAAQQLQAMPINYVGYVEGDGIFHADVDVVVADGFVGNVALKTGEGVAKLITALMKEAFLRNTFTKLGALLVKPILARFVQRIDPRMHNGASLLGLRGVVIKSHGSADEVAFANALQVAVREARIDLPKRITALWAEAKLSAPDA